MAGIIEWESVIRKARAAPPDGLFNDMIVGMNHALETDEAFSNCIYPGPHGGKSDEHFLPEGLGRFFGISPLRGRVCGTCNNRLGDEVDLPFARSGPNAFFRWRSGIHGKPKKGKTQIPSPFEKGAAGQPPLTMLGRLEGHDYDILWESQFGTDEVQPLRQIIFKDAAGSKMPVPVFDWMLREPESLRQFLASGAVADVKPVAAYASREEQPRLDAFVADLGFQVRSDWSSEALPTQRIRLGLGAPVDERYNRGLAKVGFHYALAALPDLAGSEPELARIKEAVWGDDGDTGDLVIQESQQIFLRRDGDRMQRPTHWSHFVGVTREEGYLTAHVQLFAGPDHLPFPFRVRIGKDPSRLWRPRVQVAHQFVIGHPTTPAGFDGCVEDGRPLQRVIRPS